MAVRGNYYHLISFTDFYSKNENCGLLLTSRISVRAAFTHKPLSPPHIFITQFFLDAVQLPTFQTCAIFFSFKK